jgi:hypothetical protein
VIDHDETGWIQTFSGRRFHPTAPAASEVRIADIAQALSNLCRFNGHTKVFYSVAQHSVLVAANVPRQDALWALLHDAAEAYLCDLPRPVKRKLRANGVTAFDEAERWIMRAICHRFGLPENEPHSVKKADTLVLVTEARDLMAPLAAGWHHTPENGFDILPDRIVPWSPGKARYAFLQCFQELGGEEP